VLTDFKKVALIAGGGPLPHAVLAGAKASGVDVYVASLEGFSIQEDFQTTGGHFRLGELGRLIKTLRREKVEAVSFAGIVKRPDFKALRPDAGALKYLPGVIKAATHGDDALLRFVTGIFEKENIEVIGPQILCQNLLAESHRRARYRAGRCCCSGAYPRRRSARGYRRYAVTGCWTASRPKIQN